MADQAQDSKSAIDALPNGLPPLRFNDGDVVIRLSASPSSCLLLHSDILKKRMPQLAPALAERWGQSDSITHPLTGKGEQMYTLALKPVDGTLLLEGKILATVEQSPSQDWSLFHGTELASTGWPDLSSSYGSFAGFLPEVALHYRAMFALMYEYPIKLTSFCHATSGRPENPRGSTLNRDIDTIASLCAIAEYHGALECIATALIRALVAFPSMWMDIACNPAPWMRIAVKLRSKDIYLDAARQLVARGCFAEIAVEFGMTTDEAESAFKPRLDDLEATMTGARNFILRLSLTTQSYHFGGSPVYALTSFLHALSWRSATRSRATKACERFDYLATTIYSEWVIKHIAGGERLYTNAQLKTRSAQLPGLRYVISKLMDAATWDCPANLVGRATPERYASIFNLGCRYDPAGRIRSTLSELIVDAGQHLSRVFAVRDIYIDGQRHTLRRAYYDGHNDIFTYLPLNEEKMPWNSEIAWTQTSPKLMINLAPAGKDVLDAIQLEEDVTTSAAEANEAWAAWDAVRTAAGADLE